MTLWFSAQNVVQLCNYTYGPTASYTIKRSSKGLTYFDMVSYGEKQGESCSQLFGGAALLLASQFANCSSAWSARFAGGFFWTLRGPCHWRLFSSFSCSTISFTCWHWTCQMKSANNPMITRFGMPCILRTCEPDALAWFRRGKMSSIIQRNKKEPTKQQNNKQTA